MQNNKIGIIGLGFVGSAMIQSFKMNGCDVHASYDKYKNGGIGSLDSLLECDILFSALPTIYKESIQEYDKQPLEETLEFLKQHNYKGIFVCKSTVEPGTSNNLAEKFNIKIIHNPEFLTARTAFEDFHNQTHIVLGSTSLIDASDLEKVILFYKKYYNKAEISLSSSEESESMKIFCNCFYAVKIQFFNELYITCQKNGSDYNKVRDMMLKNNWINPMHTNVPGPDGKLSYGGLCFPKDTNALNNYMIRNELPNKLLNATIEERNEMREDKDNCL
jgi:nucleotide sugar dehydrogenase